MAIRGDSYSSVVEIVPFTREILDGQSSFNSTTRPTLVEVEKFIDRASGTLNLALAQVGLSTPVTNSTAKLSCDDWVTAKVAEHVALTQRGVGYSDAEGSRNMGFRNLQKSALQFAQEFKVGMERMGVTVSHGRAEGLQFTGLDAQSERTDPDDSSLEQPRFGRRLFDDGSATRFGQQEDD